MLQQTIVEELGFQPTIADPDVYRRCNRKPSGEEYWELLLVYVDDILIISHEAKKHLEKLGTFYEFNLASVGPPTRYLGANVSKNKQQLPIFFARWLSIASTIHIRINNSRLKSQFFYDCLL
jgi:hypothetical protein